MNSMGFQKIINLLDNTTNEHSRLRTKKLGKFNNDGCRTSNTNRQITFQTSMLKSILYDYSETYIPVKGSISNTGAGVNATARAADRKSKQVVFKTFDYIGRYSYSISIFLAFLKQLHQFKINQN